MFNRTLNSFVPYMYRGFKEIDELINSEEQIMDIARSQMFTTFFNTFVLTSDEEGVIMFERMLNIVAVPELEDLDFRKQRIINRLSMKAVYTYRFLKNQLDEMIGPGKWTGYIDFDDYALYIESSATNQSWYQEVSFTVNKIKPCNITFVNVPYMAHSIKINEEVSYSAKLWRYRLGSWKLGEHPFHEMSSGGIIKMTRTPSINNALCSDTAKFIASDIAYVLINGNIRIDEFRIKDTTNNVVNIEYEIHNNVTDLIKNIKLMKNDGTVLTECTVYVPIASQDTAVCKHSITVQEGE